MEIATITGTDCGCKNIAGCNCDPIGKIQLKKSVQKAKEAVKNTAEKAKEAVKNTANAAGNVAKKAVELTKKAAGMAPRTAFLQLVKLNVHAFATKLGSHRAAALAKWVKLGGNAGELNASINAGSNRKPILGIEQYEVTEGIGSAAVTVAATLAAAAPIIAVMAEFLSSKIEPTAGQEKAPTSDTAAPTEKPGETATKILEGATKILETFTGKQSQTNSSGTNYGESYSQAQNSEVQPAATTTTQGGQVNWILPALAVGALLLFTNN